MIITVTGGRDYLNRDYIYHALNKLYQVYEVTGVVLCCKNTIYAEWATDWMIPVYELMLDSDPKPTYCVVFPGGYATDDMIKTGLTIWKPYC
jgi:hypothetical protein